MSKVRVDNLATLDDTREISVDVIVESLSPEGKLEIVENTINSLQQTINALEQRIETLENQ